jgi:preprotein translocase subunit SecF
MELFKETHLDFFGKLKWPFIIASAVLLLAGIGSLIAKGGPRYGIDFRGGALIYVKFAQEPPIDRVRAVLAPKLPGGTPDVQEVRGTNELIIGTDLRDEKELEQARQTMIATLAETFGQQTGKLDINNASMQALVDRLREPLQRAAIATSEEQLRELVQRILDYRNTPPRSGIITNLDDLKVVPGVTPQVLAVLKQETYTAPYAIRNTEIVGPKIGAELRQQALLATLYALGGMLIYIGFRFEWGSGVAAVLAVLHDTIVTVGLLSIFDYEISLTVVAALLTLVGYSMNDKIVVFDRVRENLRLMRRESLRDLINVSINQTLSRTILTGGLTFLCAVCLFVFGGPVLKGFAFAFVVGIIVGTYSSIFIATPIVVLWHSFRDKRRGRGTGSTPPAPVTSAGTSARRTPAKSVR